jgi:hypothetical protein
LHIINVEEKKIYYLDIYEKKLIEI